MHIVDQALLKEITRLDEENSILRFRIKNIEQEAGVKNLRRLEKTIQQLRAEHYQLESFKAYVSDHDDDHELYYYGCFTVHLAKRGPNFWNENPNSDSFHDDPDHLPDRAW